MKRLIFYKSGTSLKLKWRKLQAKAGQNRGLTAPAKRFFCYFIIHVISLGDQKLKVVGSFIYLGDGISPDGVF